MVANERESASGNSEDAGAVYGAAYIEWKGWGEDRFAQLGEVECAYFDAELKKAAFGKPNDARVLEIGFGNGSFLAYAKRKGWKVTGTEVNRSLVETAVRRGFNAIDADDLHTLEKGSFDLVAAFDVLEHIPPTEMLSFVADLLRMLKPGGFLIARFPNADSPFGLMNQSGDLTHRNAIGLGKVRYLARELGVRLVSFRGQAVPVCGSPARAIRRLFGLALFRIIDSSVNTIFFPNDHIAFCSSNVVMILQASTIPAPHILP